MSFSSQGVNQEAFRDTISIHKFPILSVHLWRLLGGSSKVTVKEGMFLTPKRALVLVEARSTASINYASTGLFDPPDHCYQAIPGWFLVPPHHSEDLRIHQSGTPRISRSRPWALEFISIRLRSYSDV